MEGFSHEVKQSLRLVIAALESEVEASTMILLLSIYQKVNTACSFIGK
jgi:hypothetical protein